MGSSDENSGDEQSKKMTLQIKVKDGTLKQVQTRLDATVEEFRLLVAEQTGVPPDQQNLVCEGRMLKDPDLELRSYNLEPGQIINLGILGSSSNPADTPRRATLRQNATLDINDVFFIRKFAAHPGVATLLKSPVGLQYILLFLVYVEISSGTRFVAGRKTDNVDAHIEESSSLKNVSSLATMLHKLSQSFYSMNLVGNSHNANGSRSNSAPNSNPLPNPWVSSSYSGSGSSVGQACVSDESISNLKKDCSEIVDKLMPLLTSDSTLLTKCKEKGIFIDGAYTVISDPKSTIDDQYRALNDLGREVCAYFLPIEMRLREIHHGMDSDSSCQCCGGGDDCSAENAAVVDWLAPQLEQMGRMGFMDRRQNLLALIFSRCKLGEAVKVFPTTPIKVNPGEEEAPLVEQFASELSQLEYMGFTDRSRILTALHLSGGNVDKAAKMLHKQLNPDYQEP